MRDLTIQRLETSLHSVGMFDAVLMPEKVVPVRKARELPVLVQAACTHEVRLWSLQGRLFWLRLQELTTSRARVCMELNYLDKVIYAQPG